MKKLKFLILLFIGISIGATMIQLYTQEQITKLGKSAAQNALMQDDKIMVAPMQLGNLLYANVHANIGENESAGNLTPESYKKGWRSMIAGNPALAHEGLNLFGKTFFDAYNKEVLKQYEELKLPTAYWRICHYVKGKSKEGDSLLGRWYSDSLQIAKNLSEFTLKKYWEVQRSILDRYQEAVRKLLLLEDARLNSFIADIGKEQTSDEHPAATNVHKWFFEQGLISVMTKDDNTWDDSDHGGWAFTSYPCDLLFLTYRVNSAYPEWTARKFLMEVDKFASEVRNILPLG